MRTSFIETLMECAELDERVTLITADMGFSVLEKFAAKFPSRFLNVGISEQNAVSVAAGLAACGRIVYVYSIVPFVTMRCFEQVRVDLAYQKSRVRLVGVGGGLSYGPAGPTHHSIEDIALMRVLPHMTVLCPGDPIEAKCLTRASVSLPGPAYLRLGKNGEPRVHSADRAIEMGKLIPIFEGTEGTLLACGNILDVARQVVEQLAGQGKCLSLWSSPTVKPLDTQRIQSFLNLGKPIFTLEEHSILGGFGSAVAEMVSGSPTPVPLIRLGLPDEYTHEVGSQEYLRKHFKLDPTSLVGRILQCL